MGTAQIDSISHNFTRGVVQWASPVTTILISRPPSSRLAGRGHQDPTAVLVAPPAR